MKLQNFLSVEHNVDVLFNKILCGQFYLSCLHYSRNEVMLEDPRKKKTNAKDELLDETILRVRRLARAMMICRPEYSVVSGYTATCSGHDS